LWVRREECGETGEKQQTAYCVYKASFCSVHQPRHYTAEWGFVLEAICNDGGMPGITSRWCSDISS
jgi:hypothetical protein